MQAARYNTGAVNTLDNWQSLPQAWRDVAFAEPDTVLLESTLPSTEQHHSYLFRAPVRLLVANDIDLRGFFREVERALAEDLHLAGFLTYEAGVALQGLSAHPLPPDLPRAIFGAYRSPEVFDHLSSPLGPAEVLAEPVPPLDLALMPRISFASYTKRIAEIREWIAAGDTYQVNFTMQLQSSCGTAPASIYDLLAREQPSSYSAVLRLGTSPTILSFSPELFFQTTATGSIATRPMKGTATRQFGTQADADARAALRADPKNRAEHVMIVDLLRNDLGRLCEMGSIQVHDLLRVETYPTVHQMVSTVTGKLRPRLRWQEIFTALFPSGSITGAPKRHTMELIHRLEPAARGVYTGAIGHISPDGTAAFSVAIRTLVSDSLAGTATMGVGSGIVTDSRADEEYRECLLKSRFVRRCSKPMQLIETMLAIDGQIALLERHLSRLSHSAIALGFSYDRSGVQAAIRGRVPVAGSHRVRLTLNQDGNSQIETNLLQPWPASLRVRLSAVLIHANDPALQHKTTHREVYDRTLQNARADGFDEVIFQNTAGELTEGCVTSLLVRCGGQTLTPPLSAGVLPGIFRGILLDSAQVIEQAVLASDLRSAEGVFLCNSIRGMVPVREILLPSGEVLQYDTWSGP